MNCPNCKSIIKPGDIFCRSCGTKVDFNQSGTAIEEQVTNNLNNNIEDATIEEKAITFDDLLDAYIGKKASKLKSGFSFCTMLFGVLYIFYRKMWVLGFIWLFLNVFSSIFLSNSIIFGLIVNIFIAFCFKEIYISYASDKVRKIKAQYPNHTDSELLYICSKKGGTTIVPIILIAIGYILIFFLSAKIILNNLFDAAGENIDVQFNTAYNYNSIINIDNDDYTFFV